MSNAFTTTAPATQSRVMTLSERFNTVPSNTLADEVERAVAALAFIEDLKERIAVPLGTPFLFDAYAEYGLQVEAGRITAENIRKAFERLDVAPENIRMALQRLEKYLGQ